MPGASEGRSMRTCAGNCTGIDPRTLGGSAASVFFSLSLPLSLSYLLCLRLLCLSFRFSSRLWSPNPLSHSARSFTRIPSRSFVKCLPDIAPGASLTNTTDDPLAIDNSEFLCFLYPFAWIDGRKNLYMKIHV